MRVTLTPPAGYTPPGAGAYIGNVSLPALRQDHPELTPPAKAGEANWGYEPGVPVAPGAKRVTFYAASDQPGVVVHFAAGADFDDIKLADRSEVLDRNWKEISMSLVGGKTGSDLVAGFKWKFQPFNRPVTFYLDNIVWDAVGETPPTLPMGNRDNRREMLFINDCSEPVWVGVLVGQGGAPSETGFQLNSRQNRKITIPAGFWSGRFWGRTGCSFTGAGGQCETGTCPGGLQCQGGGEAGVTLAEITYTAGDPNPDFYDVSLVDGYNLPMAMGPLPGSHGRNPGAPVDCLVPSCTLNLQTDCPNELRIEKGGKLVGCASACTRFGNPEFCCPGGTPETCPPFESANKFKALCPSAYSYAYDDATSTFTCKGEDYAVWFCPPKGM